MTQPNDHGQQNQQWGPPQQYGPQNQQWGPQNQQWGPPQNQQWDPQNQQWGPSPSPTAPIGSSPWGNSPPPPKKRWPWVVAGIVGVLAVVGIANSGSDKGQPAAQTPAVAAATSQPAASAPSAAASPRASARSTTPADAAAPTSAPSATSWTMPNLRGTNLQNAQDKIQALTADGIFFTGSHDVGGGTRMQILDADWQVCSQNVSAGTRIDADTQIDFGVVKTYESCP